MRKHSLALLAATILLSFMQSTQAQNGSPYWSLAGNSNASGSSKLGTTNNVNLRLFTNNLERLRINASNGWVGIGTTALRGRLTLFNGATTIPAASWVTANSPMLVSYADGTAGNGDFYLTQASNSVTTRSNIINRRARGTLASPTAVANNDYIGSFQASGYDGSAFQNAANVDFFVDGTPYSGNVPIRIAFSTGTNLGNRTERLVIKSDGYVGIGTASPSNELHVIGRGRFSNGLSIEESGIYSVHTTGNGVEAYGNTSYGSGVTGNGYYGVYGVGNYVGTWGTASASGSYGLVGYGNYIGTYASGNTYGVYGYTPGGLDLADPYGQSGVYGYNSTYGYGVGGYCVNGSGVFGYSDNYYAGYFVGDVYASGSYVGSDQKLKTNITSIETAVDLITKLKPKAYEYRQDGAYKFMNLPEGRHYGLIAQDLEQVLPNLVKETKFNTRMAQPVKPDPKNPAAGVQNAQQGEAVEFKAVNYIELIPVLVKAVQEQQAEIESLKSEVSRLKQGQGSVTYSDAGSLSQATPNPARGSTRINYTLPQGATSGQLLLLDAAGKALKAVSLNGSGTMELSTVALPGGTYTYSLMVGGKILETKKLTVAH